MKRSEAQKEFKATIRMNCQLLEQWKEGEISFGRMAEELSKSILCTTDNIGMLPPGVNKPSCSTGSYCTADINFVNEWQPE